jgi:hypothetical protein
VGKSRTPNLHMRNRYTGKCCLTAGAFYPELVKMGKKVLKNQVRHGYAVDHRFVQCGGVKKPRNASSSERCDF